MTEKIKSILSAESEHHLGVVPAGRHDNLSTFGCSCGQRFVPNSLGTTPRTAPSMPAVHRAAAILAALGLPGGSRAQGPDDLAGAESGTVIEFGGLLMQLSREGYDKPWFAQDGTALATSEIAGKVTVMWAP